MRNRLFAPNSIAVAIGVGVVPVIGAAVAALWTGIGDPNLSAAGWIAMSFGVITHAGIGLMALVFIGSRRGYGGRSSTAQPGSGE